MFLYFSRASLFVLGLVVLCFVYLFVFPLGYCSVVSTSAIDCLVRLVSEMTYYVSSVVLNLTYSLTARFSILPDFCHHFWLSDPLLSQGTSAWYSSIS